MKQTNKKDIAFYLTVGAISGIVSYQYPTITITTIVIISFLSGIAWAFWQKLNDDDYESYFEE